jgi:hypothetical protein
MLRVTNAYLERKSARFSRSSKCGVERVHPALQILHAEPTSPGPDSRGRLSPHVPSLHQALIQHGIGYFQEACDVGAVYEVAGRAVFLGRFEAVAVDGDHDFVELVIHFFA